MATLDGVNIFHLCTVSTELTPTGFQRTAYPGVNGVAGLTLGSRGAISSISGFLIGATTADVNTAEATFRTYQANGLAYTFVDNHGNSWDNVRVLQFSPGDRVLPCAAASLGGSGYCRPYKATLEHLSV